MEYVKTTLDKAVMAISAGLMLLGIVVFGLIETLAGQPYGAAPMTNDAGEVVATPLIDPNLRTGLVILALVLLLLWGLYKLGAPQVEQEEGTAAPEMTAD